MFIDLIQLALFTLECLLTVPIIYINNHNVNVMNIEITNITCPELIFTMYYIPISLQIRDIKYSIDIKIIYIWPSAAKYTIIRTNLHLF